MTKMGGNNSELKKENRKTPVDITMFTNNFENLLNIK